MHRPLLHGFLALALLAAPRVDATETVMVPADLSPRIVNGLYTSLYPSTGALLDSGDFSVASLICSGTLIGCQTFLTAGHCVEGNLNPASYSVFLQHAGFFAVSSIALHPTFNFPVGDVAVLTLATPVTGVAPTPIDAGPAPAFGTPGTIAGFGRSGGGSDYGLKRVGDVVTGSCTGGVSSTTSVCWVFSSPLGPPGTDSNTCNGDSGGPLFVAGGGGSVVAGVTSGGTSNDCSPTDNSYDANVAFYASYIQAQGGADLANTSCGAMPQAGAPDTTILASVGQVDALTTQGRHSFTVGSGIGRVRVAMNAVDNGSDFDLYVKAGAPPTTSDYDCRQYGPNQYAFCEFATPAPGTWHVLVNRFGGGGTYQVTTTLFGIDCSQPGTDGQTCDDGDPCTGTDVCQAGTCGGTPIADGTPCDDGNVCTSPDTCQSGACTGTLLPDGSPCDDGHVCTRDDACVAGACTPGAAPTPGCRRPVVTQRGLFQLKDNVLNDNRDRFVWRWQAGALTNKIDFGNPRLGTDYGLCVYDESGDVPELVMERTIPSSATLWAELATGFKYNDRTYANAGLRSVTLKAGVAGRASISVKGQGLGIGVPTLPLHQQSKVTVQLLGPNDTCWEADYSTTLTNDAAQFKARAD